MTDTEKAPSTINVTKCQTALMLDSCMYKYAVTGRYTDKQVVTDILQSSGLLAPEVNPVTVKTVSLDADHVPEGSDDVNEVQIGEESVEEEAAEEAAEDPAEEAAESPEEEAAEEAAEEASEEATEDAAEEAAEDAAEEAAEDAAKDDAEEAAEDAAEKAGASGETPA